MLQRQVQDQVQKQSLVPVQVQVKSHSTDSIECANSSASTRAGGEGGNPARLTFFRVYQWQGEVRKGGVNKDSSETERHERNQIVEKQTQVRNGREGEK